MSAPLRPSLTGRSSRISIFVWLFLLALVVPSATSLYLGPMRLSAYRIVLILAIIPCFVTFATGRAGKLNYIDLLMVLYVGWGTLSLFVAHSFGDAWEFAGMNAVESLMPYSIARVYVRSAADLKATVRILFWIVVAMLPFAVYESIARHHILHDFFQLILGGPGLHWWHEERWGMNRAFGTFEHPILFGVFCATALGLSVKILGYGKSFTKKSIFGGSVFAASFFSFSSGPLVGIVVQFILMSWDRFTRRIRHRWLILGGLFTTSWIAVSLLSTRHPIVVFIYYFTFNAETAYGRLRIWDFGTASVAKHPTFGIGLNEWERLWWMSSSMDNFWLVQAVRYGIPGFIFLSAACLLLYIGLGRLSLTDDRLKAYRAGLLISLVGLTVAGATVHLWNQVFVLFVFLLGCCIWLFDEGSKRRQKKT